VGSNEMEPCLPDGDMAVGVFAAEGLGLVFLGAHVVCDEASEAYGREENSEQV
jgi:hypothetical protein